MAKVIRHNQATLEELKNDFYEFSRKTSENVRQLALAGVAIIWIFKIEVGGKIAIPNQLIDSLKFFIYTLSTDFLHAFIPSIIYGVYQTYLKSKGKQDKEAVHFPSYLTIPAWTFYILKIVFLLFAYIHILIYIKHYLEK